MIRLDDDSREELARLARRDDPFAIFSEPPEGVDSQMREALSGRHDTIRAKLVERLQRRGIMPWITPMHGALLAGIGIDPLAIAVLGLADVLGAFDLVDGREDPTEDGEDCLVRMADPAMVGSHIRLAKGVYWRMEGVVVMQLPDTAIATIQTGAALSSVLSHPTLDQYHLHVKGVDRIGQAWLVMTDAATQVPLDLEGILACRP